MKNIAIQCLLRPALTVVDRCLDDDNFRATIDRIDRLLIDSEVESQAIELALEGWPPMGLIPNLIRYDNKLFGRSVCLNVLPASAN